MPDKNTYNHDGNGQKLTTDKDILILWKIINTEEGALSNCLVCLKHWQIFFMKFSTL